MVVSIPQVAAVLAVPERTLRYWVWQERLRPVAGSPTRPLWDWTALATLVESKRRP